MTRRGTPSDTPARAADSAGDAAAAAASTQAPDRALVERYLQVLAVERKLSPYTVNGYRHELEVLLGLTAAARPPRALPQLANHDIRRHAASLHARGLGGRSIARALSACAPSTPGWPCRTCVRPTR